MLIHKILRAAEWAEFDAAGSYAGSADDRRDGFIHMSTPDQLPGTLAKHFAGEGALVIVDLDADALGAALRWEESRGGMLFPHLYRALERADIVRVRPVPPSPA